MKVTRVPNINAKTRHQKLQNHLYNAGRDSSQNPGRDSPTGQMPKLQNLNLGGAGGGGNILPKVNEQSMRSTHLKLDPIDTSA